MVLSFKVSLFIQSWKKKIEFEHLFCVSVNQWRSMKICLFWSKCLPQKFTPLSEIFSEWIITSCHCIALLSTKETEWELSYYCLWLKAIAQILKTFSVFLENDGDSVTGYILYMYPTALPGDLWGPNMTSFHRVRNLSRHPWQSTLSSGSVWSEENMLQNREEIKSEGERGERTCEPEGQREEDGDRISLTGRGVFGLGL